MEKIRSLAVAGLFAFVAANCGANTLVERFAADPLQNGWQIYGDTNLFQWDSTNQVLDVTWDSTQPDSYFYLPLGRAFTKADGFCIAFDLNLADTDVAGYFELAIGLCNFAGATSPSFSRANGFSPDLLEFDYFPDGPASYGPSMDATLVDSADNFFFAYDATQPMATNTTYRVLLIHQPDSSVVSGVILTNGQPFTTFPLTANYGTDNFNLDTLAIMNYTTLDDSYGDLLLAHGTVDNLAFTSPLPVQTIQALAPGQVQFISDTNWLYTLEQSSDLQNWSPAAPATSGNGTNLVLQATNLPPDKMFYRVGADLP